MFFIIKTNPDNRDTPIDNAANTKTTGDPINTPITNVATPSINPPDIIEFRNLFSPEDAAFPISANFPVLAAFAMFILSWLEIPVFILSINNFFKRKMPITTNNTIIAKIGDILIAGIYAPTTRKVKPANNKRGKIISIKGFKI